MLVELLPAVPSVAAGLWSGSPAGVAAVLGNPGAVTSQMFGSSSTTGIFGTAPRVLLTFPLVVANDATPAPASPHASFDAVDAPVLGASW